MNSSTSRGSATPPEWDRLELAVRRLLEAVDSWQSRAQAAEQRIHELESALRDVASGGLDPLALAQRVEALEQENGALRSRLEQARGSIRRILSRLQLQEGP
ncbi:MAG: hypothetical protein HY703_01790 [Gemmatimonadetes bacterium]|nr:hypothetical protein [Gemmatimonadota bacterium]